VPRTALAFAGLKAHNEKRTARRINRKKPIARRQIWRDWKMPTENRRNLLRLHTVLLQQQPSEAKANVEQYRGVQRADEGRNMRVSLFLILIAALRAVLILRRLDVLPLRQARHSYKQSSVTV